HAAARFVPQLFQSSQQFDPVRRTRGTRMNDAKQLTIRGLEAKQVTVRPRGTPRLQLLVLALAEAECDGQRSFALDPSHYILNPTLCQCRVLTALQHHRAVSECLRLARAIKNLALAHAIALQRTVAAP